MVRRKSRGITNVLLVLASACILLLLLRNWGAGERGEVANIDTNKRDATYERLSTMPTREEPLIATIAPDAGFVAIVVTDEITQRPLSGTTIGLLDSLGQPLLSGEPWSVDSEGVLELETSLLDQAGSIAVTPPPDYSLESFYFNAEDIEVNRRGSVVRIRIPVFSRIVVDTTVDISLLTEDAIATTRVAGIPGADILASVMDGGSLYQHLETERNLHPENFRSTLKRYILSEEFLQSERDVPRELRNALDVEEEKSARIAFASQLVFDAPYHGDVLVTAWTDHGVPYASLVSVARGTVTKVDASVAAAPSVSGHLLDTNGRPIPGEVVTVSARSRFDLWEPIPRAATQPGNPAFAVSLRLDEPNTPAVVHALLSGKTNAAGEFRVWLPFTGTVAAWAFPEGHLRAFQTAYVSARNESIAGLTLIAPHRGVNVGARMAVTYPDGTPVPGFTFLPIEDNPPNAYLLQYPIMTADEEGWVDVTLLEAGRDFAFFSSSSEYADGSFICAAEGQIVVERK